MSADNPPFSNSTMGEMWMARWCDRCKVDGPFQRGVADTGCELLLDALTGSTPEQWTEVPEGIQDYTCSEFVPDDEDGGGDPDPAPWPMPVGEMDGQTDILGMFADQIVEQAAAVEAVNV